MPISLINNASLELSIQKYVGKFQDTDFKLRKGILQREILGIIPSFAHQLPTLTELYSAFDGQEDNGFPYFPGGFRLLPSTLVSGKRSFYDVLDHRIEI